MSREQSLPRHWAGSPRVEALEEVLGAQLSALRQSEEDVLCQLAPQTAASWGMDRWEAAWGLTVDRAKPLEFRRSRVIAKLRGQGTTTATMIQDVAESFTNGRVVVSEFPAEYRVEITFVDAVGLPPNLEDLKTAVMEILPSHLAVSYVAQLHTWGEAAKMTWGEAKGLTWAELRGGTL